MRTPGGIIIGGARARPMAIIPIGIGGGPGGMSGAPEKGCGGGPGGIKAF